MEMALAYKDVRRLEKGCVWAHALHAVAGSKRRTPYQHLSSVLSVATFLGQRSRILAHLVRLGTESVQDVLAKLKMFFLWKISPT